MSSTFRPLLAQAPVALLLALGIACGGNDDGNPQGAAGSSSSGSNSGGSSSGGSNSGGSNGGTTVPGNKPLGELTDAEAAQLCEDLADRGDDLAAQSSEFSCRFSGLLAALLSGAETDDAARAVCETGYDACKAEPPDPTTTECDKPPASCTATVAELEACLNDIGPWFQQTANAFPSCDELSLDDLESIDFEPPAPPASCEAYQQKCADGPMLPGGE